jgi:hypothetical protein
MQKEIGRITGNSHIRGLTVDDIRTISKDIAEYTNIAHAGQIPAM